VLGFGVGGWGPTPKSPIPNPQSPIPIFIIKKFLKYLNKLITFIINNNNKYKN
jgi:hypothetical protein